MTKEQALSHAYSLEGWFEPEDMDVIWDIVLENASQQKKVVEVGSWKGRSSYVMAAACQTVGAKLLCIDSFKGLLLGEEHINWSLYHGSGGYYSEGNNGSVLPTFLTVMQEFIPQTVTPVEADSRQAHQDISDYSCDVVFIDGDHDEPVIGMDLRNYVSKVRPGGIYCGDDYEPGNNVSRSLQAFIKEYNSTREVDKQLVLEPTKSTLWKIRIPE